MLDHMMGTINKTKLKSNLLNFILSEQTQQFSIFTGSIIYSIHTKSALYVLLVYKVIFTIYMLCLYVIIPIPHLPWSATRGRF